ncbi:hypothetical protein M8J76_014306 [Diaphorina citri]|nr:hypothetical protein M8J76_014306 [Diaphorina citri]
MMGTLKNFLRKSPFRDKTLVKSNKFYVRGEGVKLFERKVALVKAVQTGRSESSESVMESFKSIISSTECAENCNNNMDLFKHELEEFTKPPEDTSQDWSSAKKESYFSYVSEINEEVPIKKEACEDTITKPILETTQINKEKTLCNVVVEQIGDHQENTNQFQNELKKFVMFTKKLQTQFGDNKQVMKTPRVMSALAKQHGMRKQKAGLVNRGLTEKLTNNMFKEPDVDVTSTEIIFQNSQSFEWSHSDTRVLNLYKNAQDIITTSSDTFHSDPYLSPDRDTTEPQMPKSCSQISYKTITAVSCTDVKPKPTPRKKRPKRGQTKCKKNFINKNKNLTKFILQGRQKINIMKARSISMRRKTKRKKRTLRGNITKMKTKGEEKEQPCKCENTEITRKSVKKYNKKKLAKYRQADNIIITDILYLV